MKKLTKTGLLIILTAVLILAGCGDALSNATGYGSSGGVYLLSASFTMHGRTISGNTSNSAGGGVYLSSGSFTMDGGTISDNNGSSGGGVWEARCAPT